eukprot:Sspe_Gene.51896::Locus_28783_Transcript_1_3_Confidence_0.500_Length_1968::g.51896::m.51896
MLPKRFLPLLPRIASPHRRLYSVSPKQKKADNVAMHLHNSPVVIGLLIAAQKSKLEQSYEKVGKKGGARVEELLRMADVTFREMDEDKDGVISRSEFLAYKKKDAKVWTDAVTKDFVPNAHIDANDDLALILQLNSRLGGNSVVMGLLMEVHEKHALAVFREIDSDDDGRITEAEYREYMARHIRGMDQNMDGEVSREEYVDHGTKECMTWLNAISSSYRSAAAEPARRESAGGEVTLPTPRQFLYFALRTAFPMVIFGFVDNFIMIICGNTIEDLFSARFGLTTMAAAGLGNLCSDVAGLGMAESIRCPAVPSPKLTKAQARLPVVRLVGTLSAIVGVATGCILGMAPLLLRQSCADSE